MYSGRSVRRESSHTYEPFRADPEVGDDEALAESSDHASSFQVWSAHKTFLVVKQAASIAFRCADNLLDWRAAVQFAARGHAWWASLALLFTLTAPLGQYAFVKWRKGRDFNASVYLMPASAQHIYNEVCYLRFLALLPQDALDSQMHRLVGTSSLNEILAGIECALEGFPQSVVQFRAFIVEGGGLLDIVSVACSLLSVMMGAYFALKACLNVAISKPKNDTYKELSHALSDGSIVAWANTQYINDDTIIALSCLSPTLPVMGHFDFGFSSATDANVSALAAAWPYM